MKNRSLIAVIIAIFIIVGLFYVSGKEDITVEKTKFTYYEYFDTKIDVVFYEEVEASVKEDIATRLMDVHNLTSNFDEDGLLYQLNSDYSIEYNEELAKILQYGIDYYNDYSSEFNIALGPVVDVWKGYLSLCLENNECKLPTDSELTAASKNIDPNNLVIGDTITIEADMKIDLGAVAKGYAADEINVLLKEMGYKHYLIDAGGNIVVTTKPTAEPFLVSIVNPTDTANSLMLLSVEDKAIVTSGDYERYYEVDGVRYSHLISNQTLYPSTNFRSVTVITSSSMKADVWTTMLFGMSYEDGLKLVESEADLEAVWYSSDDTIYRSSGVSKYEEE